MFFPAEERIRVHLYGQPCVMRKSFDDLQALESLFTITWNAHFNNLE